MTTNESLTAAKPARPANRWDSLIARLLLLGVSTALASGLGALAFRPLEHLLAPYHRRIDRWLRQGLEWHVSREVFLAGGVERDPILQTRYLPYSRYREYFLSNERGYFCEDSEPVTRLLHTWHLATSEGTRAALDSVRAQNEDCLRIMVTAIPPDAHNYSAGLVSAPQRFAPGSRLDVRVRARSDQPARIELVAHFADQTSISGDWRMPIELSPSWRDVRGEFRFPAVTSATSVRIFCNLAEQVGQIDLAQLAARVVGPGEALPPRRLSDGALPGDDSELIFPYYVSGEVNAQGFRDQEVEVAKPPGVFRIACLGDSYTWGTGVKQPDRWTEVLRGELGARAAAGKGPKCEVLNFGIVGYGALDERVQYEQVVRAYAPDLVVLMMCWNDNVSRRDEFSLIDRMQRKGTYTDATGRRSAEFEDRLAELFAAPFDDCRKELGLLQAACRRDGAPLVLVVFEVGYEPEWGTLQAALRGWSGPLLVLGEALERAGLKGRAGQIHYRDSHPNERAHRVAGVALDRFLRAEQLLPATSRPADTSDDTTEARGGH